MTGDGEVEYGKRPRVGRWSWQMRRTSDGRVWICEGRWRLIGLLASEKAFDGRTLIAIRACLPGRDLDAKLEGKEHKGFMMSLRRERLQGLFG